MTLSLTGLPAQDTITLELLFAAIGSLDGTGTFPSGDFFRIVFDGDILFSESFANALPSQTQSYVSAAGVELTRRQILVLLVLAGPIRTALITWALIRASRISHTGSTATIQFFIFSEGNPKCARTVRREIGDRFAILFLTHAKPLA